MDYMYNIGEKAYYLTWYGKLKEVSIIDRRAIRHINAYGSPYSTYEYIVKFSNGKLKKVSEDNLF